MRDVDSDSGATTLREKFDAGMKAHYLAVQGDFLTVRPRLETVEGLNPDVREELIGHALTFWARASQGKPNPLSAEQLILLHWFDPLPVARAAYLKEMIDGDFDAGDKEKVTAYVGSPLFSKVKVARPAAPGV